MSGTGSIILAIDPLLVNSSFFPLNINRGRGNASKSELITPYGIAQPIGQIVQLNATQVVYSFDYYEVWPPNVVYESNLFYPTRKGFVVSFDPRTKVILNATGSITGSNSTIVARYR